MAGNNDDCMTKSHNCTWKTTLCSGKSEA